jgi:sulfofructose kinase
VGKLGDDHAAKVHLEQFAASGVEAQVTTVPGCASAQSFILVDPQGERTVLWRKDERLELHEADLKHEWIVNARVLHVDGSDTAAAIAAANWARSAGIPTIADLDEVYSGLDALLELIDYLIVSRHFPSQLLGENDLRKSLPLLQSRFGSTLTAATLGNAGVLAWDGQKFHSACAYRVPVVDTTGAGDIFHAGFIYGLLQGWAVQRQLEFACAAAALNCMAHGARGGVRPITEIEDLMTRGPRYPVAFDTVVGSLWVAFIAIIVVIILDAAVIFLVVFFLILVRLLPQEPIDQVVFAAFSLHLPILRLGKTVERARFCDECQIARMLHGFRTGELFASHLLKGCCWFGSILDGISRIRKHDSKVRDRGWSGRIWRLDGTSASK